LSKLFRRLDSATLEAALSRWLLSRQPAGWEALALDGKTSRGTATGEAPASTS